MLTSSMSRLSYAHVLVEIDLRKTLPEQIDVSLPNGVVINQKVIYETLSKFCTFCNVIGHLVDSCSKLPKDLGGGFPHANDASLIDKSPPVEIDIRRNVQVSEWAGPLQASSATTSPMDDAWLQDPMVCEAATVVHDWESVPKETPQ
ncbi:hypothetical protein OIU76_029999 [Salix suchowensis]|nr:hypothetical protein OIU76_029999 [Salix suchowensis]